MDPSRARIPGPLDGYLFGLLEILNRKELGIVTHAETMTPADLSALQCMRCEIDSARADRREREAEARKRG